MGRGRTAGSCGDAEARREAGDEPAGSAPAAGIINYRTDPFNPFNYRTDPFMTPLLLERLLLFPDNSSARRI